MCSNTAADGDDDCIDVSLSSPLTFDVELCLLAVTSLLESVLLFNNFRFDFNYG